MEMEKQLQGCFLNRNIIIEIGITNSEAAASKYTPGCGLLFREY